MEECIEAIHLLLEQWYLSIERDLQTLDVECYLKRAIF